MYNFNYRTYGRTQPNTVERTEFRVRLEIWDRKWGLTIFRI